MYHMRTISKAEACKDIKERIETARSIYEKYVNQGLLNQTKVDELCISLEKRMYNLLKLQYIIVE